MSFVKRFLLGLILIIFTFIVCVGFWFFNANMFDMMGLKKVSQVPGIKIIEVAGAEEVIELKLTSRLPENKEVERVELTNGVLDVPFTSQAPYGEWDNPIYQDGCEEAASLMAIYWAQGQNISKLEANKELIAMANWQTENYGEFRDTSVDDTMERIIKGYFDYQNILVKKNINLDNIISGLEKGNLIIVPTNGRTLGNPYYTLPGPERHNLVIRGYDRETDEFITNDPGTKRGEGYRYKSSVLFEAIRDYPTGYHLAITEAGKNMIVVKK